MALVKILQNGGKPIDQNILNTELDKTIGTFGLKRRDERKVRDALTKLRDYFANDPDGKSISIDPVAKKYTISGPDSNKFEGSADDIKRGWLSGNLRIVDDDDAMSVAASIYGEAINNLKNTNSQKSEEVAPITKEKRNILSLDDIAMGANAYGSRGEYESVIAKANSPESRRKLIYDTSRIGTKAYIEEYEKNKDKYDYEDYETVSKLHNVLSAENIDHDKFLELSRKLRWEPSKYELSEEELKVIKENKDKENKEIHKNTLITQGYDPKFANDISTTGYTEIVSNYDFIDQVDLRDKVSQYLSEKGMFLLKNPTTGYMALSTKKGLTDFEEKDRFSPLYGYSGKNYNDGFKLETQNKIK